jgi:hypothetical protein
MTGHVGGNIAGLRWAEAVSGPTSFFWQGKVLQEHGTMPSSLLIVYYDELRECDSVKQNLLRARRVPILMRISISRKQGGDSFEE